MKITLDIQESKYSAFVALMKTLEYVSIPDEESIPQWQIDEALKRLDDLRKYPENGVDFDTMVNEIEEENGL